MSDEEDYIYGYDEEDDFQLEAKAYERLGGAVLLSQLTGKKKGVEDPIERFSVQVDAISRKLKEYGNITESDIVMMLDKANNLKNIEHKNPTAYILGFIASEKGKNITKKSADFVFKNVLPYAGENIEKEDVIRYARLWLNL